MAKIVDNVAAAADEILQHLSSEIRLAAPIGIGKPNLLLNELYARVKQTPRLRLKIYTALSLNPPSFSQDLLKRFFKPFAERHWGKEYPDLHYIIDAEKDRLPNHVLIHEFYFRAGSALKSGTLQRNYQCINYTHVAEALEQAQVNVIVQVIASCSTSGKRRYSLGTNPDVTLDLVDAYKKEKKPLFKVAFVHPEMPFFDGDPEISEDFFDLIIHEPTPSYSLFALPRLPITDEDHAIGFYASQLIADDGTLQIGIGSLCDSVVAALILRHEKNNIYKNLVQQSWPSGPSRLPLHTSTFEKGLYGLNELVTDGYMHLRKRGLLKRLVRDEKRGTQTYLHGAFCLGSKEFYEWLRSLKNEDRSGFRMTRVSKVNDLYDPNEVQLRHQRKNGRFLNTCMQVTLLGGACSETLEDGRVVSGVGGQYNFVAMADELKTARSILMLRSTRSHQGRRLSNIVASLNHQTIPRHLRDIFVTEYGIADLRNKTDEQCIKALIEIADAEFQEELVSLAKKQGKLSSSYQVPTFAANNTPERLKNFIRQGEKLEVFTPFPFGSDFTPEEEKLAVALGLLQNELESVKPWKKIFTIMKWIFSARSMKDEIFAKELSRMNLKSPKNLKERIARWILIYSLDHTKDKFVSNPISKTGL